MSPVQRSEHAQTGPEPADNWRAWWTMRPPIELRLITRRVPGYRWVQVIFHAKWRWGRDDIYRGLIGRYRFGLLTILTLPDNAVERSVKHGRKHEGAEVSWIETDETRDWAGKHDALGRHW